MKRVPIPSRPGQYALVSNRDYDLVSDITWSIVNGYPAHQIVSPNGKWGTEMMHRLIMGRVGIDHKNLNKLDNRRSNLRDADPSQQSSNRTKLLRNGSSTSKYKGVRWHVPMKKWQARIKVDYKSITLGFFTSEEEAARAYDEAAIQYQGAFARTNF